MIANINYGKANVSFYRTYARPFTSALPIPESAFTGRPNTLFACSVDVDVLGDHFARAYTHGDNSSVVATDTMKNFIHRMALDYEGSTLEGFLHFLGRRFFDTWPEMRSLRISGRELPFTAARVPVGDGEAFADSEALFSRGRGEFAVATIEIEREGAGARVTDHRCGCEQLQLIKITGSSFARFVRDEYTTLPETVDRPLFIYLDVYWKYADVADAISAQPARYIPAEQARDLVQVVFHEFVSMSIQHLVHEMGQRLLGRLPQMAEVSFVAQNRLWDTAAVSEADDRIKVYCDPRPPYGQIGLRLRRE